jgi:hypothetical protein
LLGSRGHPAKYRIRSATDEIEEMVPGLKWPPVGSRVSIRYRRAPGSVPPLTDVVGYLLEVEPLLRVRNKRGEVLQIDPSDVVAVRAVGEPPSRKYRETRG